MTNSNASVINREFIKNLRVAETMLLLLGSVILQFIIHLIPPVNGIPLGQILLPAFYAPLIAILFFRLHVGLIAAIAGPILNYFITGAPKPEILAALTIEVAIFTIVYNILINDTRIKNTSAFISIIAAVLFSFLLLPILDESSFANANFLQSFIIIIPGIVLLSFLNIFLLRYKSK